MGSKLQRKNQHINKLRKKIKKFKEKGKSVEKMEKELLYCTGEAERPSFKTGSDASNDKSHKRR
tara:strand:+ start:19 stop:210 length:192 start_codon:yes stop_codon:yes gene_type:complete